MKKFLPLLTSFFILLNLFVYNVQAEEKKANSNVIEYGAPETDRVIVQLETSVKSSSLEEYEVVDQQIGQNSNLISLEVPEHLGTDDFIEELEDRKDVVYAEPDSIIQLNYLPSDPYYYTQWHHKKIETEIAWNKSKGSSDVVVAVIDNGIDMQHPDLRGRIVSPYDVIEGSTYYINPGEHGTHVAGIIASSIDNGHGGAGVAPNAQIMPINVFMGDSAYTSDVIQGIYYAVGAGADIINMSLGSYSYSYSFNSAVQYAYQNGVVIVAAAGNDATSSSHYPSSFENVISVSSTDSYDSRSYFSNYGYDIDVAAPGSDIYSTLPNGSYGYMSGTSMASPVVAGVAALILSNAPQLSNNEVANRIFESADDVGSRGWDSYYGYGRVNAKSALGAIEIQQPHVYEVSDQDKEVNGTILDDIGLGTVEVRDGSKLLGSTSVSSYSSFSVPIPIQQAGTTLMVKVTDNNGNSSESVEIVVVDRTPPKEPLVNNVNSTSNTITGKAEPNSTVYAITTEGSYTSTSDSNGQFNISIPLLPVDSLVEIYVVDHAGNASSSIYLYVLDKTSPDSPSVNIVTDVSKAVSGKTEALASIEVKENSKVIGTGKSSKEGSFDVTIPLQKVGTKLSIIAIDLFGNRSKATMLTVKDGTPPTVKVDSVSDSSKEITGRTEAGGTVTVVIDGKKYSAVANVEGNFKITIPVQQAGTKLSLSVADAAGNVSPTQTIVVIDKTAPTVPTVNAVSDKTKEVSGKAEAGATVTVTIGSKKYSAKADGKGNYKVKIPLQKAGTKITITAKDRAGNGSKGKKVTVLDKTPPAAPKVNTKVKSTTKELAGTAERNATITVKVGSKVIGTSKTDSKGKFRVKIKTQKKNAELKVTATDAARNMSKATIIKVK